MAGRTRVGTMPDAALSAELDEQQQCIHIKGPLTLAHYAQAQAALRKDGRAVDLSGVTQMDTAGALLLLQNHAKLQHVHPEHQSLLEMVAHAQVEEPPRRKTRPALVRSIAKLGNATIAAWQAMGEFIRFTGQACITLLKVARHPSRLRTTPILYHIEAIGIDAIPIISLIAFVISVVLAYQGQVQLKPLGAEKYTVNLISISVLREMGVLLTAIMVAGRSGSAFTAEIGVMKVREEVDALRTMGLDPFELLVLPRLIALLVALPLLAFIADAMGLFGGGLISLSLLNISMTQYLEQARQAATWKDLLVGLIKAPVFAFVIALVGCMHGLKVSGSSESVGKETTASVVEAIFLVLVLDGIFSVYFQKVGL